MIREYLPILLHIVVAIGFAASALLISIILGKAGAPSATGDAHIRTNSHGYAYGMRF